MTASTPAFSVPASIGDPRRWWILAITLTAEIMDLLDSTVVNVAGPSLERQLGASPTALQWVIGGYPLALGAGLILGGRLGDRFGRRRIFLIGVVGFTVASLCCGLAPNIGLLIAFRLVQGAAGALLLPQGFGLIRAAFPPKELGSAFAVYGPVFGLGAIFGPIIGGALIQADLFSTGWRLVFFVNVPIGIAATVVASRLLPHEAGDRALNVDLVGAALVVIASGLVVLPLIQGQQAGWPAWTWLCLAVGLLGYAAFAFQQRSRAARGGTPLVVPSILRKVHYDVGLAGIALFFAGSVGTQLVLTLFLQIGERYGAGSAGLANVPLALGSGIGGAVSGALLADRLGRSVLQIGAVVQLAGALLLWSEVGSLQAFDYWHLLPGLVVAGIGTGLVVAALFNVLLGAVDDDEVGSASGVLSAVQSIAASIGVAVFGSAFFAATKLGRPDDGFRDALLIQVALLVVFLAVSPLFPRRARPDGPPTGDPLSAESGEPGITAVGPH